MIFHLLFLLFFFGFLPGFSQQSDSDLSWWNELHNWEEGELGWRNRMIISPGYLGPNALPVPHVQKGDLTGPTEFEITFSNHFLKGDPTQDISGYTYIPFANNKIAIEMYGVIREWFAFSEEIRDQRIARNKNGKGIAVGDFYFSTLIQIVKDKKFPNTLVRLATRTASGNQLESARYSDTPGYFFDLSLSKEINTAGSIQIKPFGSIGFRAWQTYDTDHPQNDAYMYSIGSDLIKNYWLFSASCSGYSGYKKQNDRPLQLNFDLRKDFNQQALRFQYLHGLRDWEYKTIRFSYIWKINRVE